MVGAQRITADEEMKPEFAYASGMRLGDEIVDCGLCLTSSVNALHGQTLVEGIVRWENKNL